MKYLCVNCNYIYDKAFWDKQENIEIWTELEKCPVCLEYNVFHWIEEEVNYIDINTLWPLEIDHFPDVKITENKLKVIIWNEIHPMWEEHRIASVSLYDEYSDLIEEKYLEMETEAVTEFYFDDLDEFEIRVKCSLHGVWWRKFKN
mgnify:CR=1 FL=1